MKILNIYTIYINYVLYTVVKVGGGRRRTESPFLFTVRLWVTFNLRPSTHGATHLKLNTDANH